jgi:hypothetical protein
VLTQIFLQEIKRRTKTGCLTCRKRRIKVSFIFRKSVFSRLYEGRTRSSVLSRCGFLVYCKRIYLSRRANLTSTLPELVAFAQVCTHFTTSWTFLQRCCPVRSIDPLKAANRKHHIQCDEGMPSCRNCQKSKRECQGYDPVFKNAPGPAAIQPAPSSSPAIGSIATTAHPYGNQPHLLQGSVYGAGNMAYDPALNTSTTGQSYDYSSAIDPALEAAALPITAAGTPYHQTSPGKEL